MPRKRTKVLCTIPLPMTMQQFVDVSKAIASAFEAQGRKTYIRNGKDCYEVFEIVENGTVTQEDPSELPLE